MTLSRKTRIWLRVLGYYQLIGGIMGFSVGIYLTTTVSTFNSWYLIIFATDLVLYLYSIICGILLLRQHTKGIGLSIVNQLFQLVGFAAGGYAFRYIAGLYLTFEVDLSESFNIFLGTGVSSFRLYILTDNPARHFSFNFVALIVIIALFKLQSRIKTEQKLNLFEETGLAG